MPQTKEQTGWQLPSYINFRTGQKELYEVISANPNKKHYAVKLPTGYGKSWCACIAYATLRGQGIVDRALLIVPTDTQRSQYVKGLQEDLAKMGIEYNGIERCDTQQAWVIKKSLRNESDIFVATVQSISSNPGWFFDLMYKNRWLVVADEFHHYGEDNTWGDAIKKLPAQTLLGMSATPFRGDKTATIFGGLKFDVEVSVKDAIEEKALRGIEVYECEYDVTFTSGSDGDPQTVMMSELEQIVADAGLTLTEWELKQKIRYHTKYVHSMLTQAISAWIEYESRYPGQNQILVFAMTCKHAESVTKAINDLAFPGLPKPFADWVGTGEGETEGRTKEQNVKIIEQFQANRLPCLVQVNLAGEGFNNKRCSIGIMLDLIGDTPMKRQHIGRFVRVNPATPNQLAVIFASTDAPCLPLLKALEEETAPEPEDQQKQERDGLREMMEGKQLTIPDLLILDTNLQRVTKSYPYGTLEKTVEAFKSQNPEFASASDEAIAKAVESFLMKVDPIDSVATSEDRRNQISQDVQRAIGRIVNYVLKKRFGSSFPKSAKGDMYRKIHGRYAKTHGLQKTLTEEELRAKYEWLKELTAEVNRGGIPTWLSL